MPTRSLLFRGASIALHQANGGRIVPKTMSPFTHQGCWDQEGGSWDSGATWDESETNAVVQHQLLQKGLPTSGISTTPHVDRAVFYATGGHQQADGLVYIIDRDALADAGVREFVVADYVAAPSVPADDEVVLVEKSFGALPESVLLRTVRVAEVHQIQSTFGV
jgi:hypothetical protein